ncbi:hypothetical protein PCANC_14625 [Puccinia coronata f. sp. avenae]|uniref:Uncharacterized protein n=1 Tax=Puccinia coronata f. sp. avenae TaxID=200324 RepID=A0A2N5SV54_9BASI|nr:hypothetical protein PCANC_14625 [Puccinia coronata f. sp. avenae]
MLNRWKNVSSFIILKSLPLISEFLTVVVGIRIALLREDTTLAMNQAQIPSGRSFWQTFPTKMNPTSLLAAVTPKRSRKKYLKIESDEDIAKLSMEQRRTAIVYFYEDYLQNNLDTSRCVSMIGRITTAAPPTVKSGKADPESMAEAALKCLAEIQTTEALAVIEKIVQKYPSLKTHLL